MTHYGHTYVPYAVGTFIGIVLTTFDLLGNGGVACNASFAGLRVHPVEFDTNLLPSGTGIYFSADRVDYAGRHACGPVTDIKHILELFYSDKILEEQGFEPFF